MGNINFLNFRKAPSDEKIEEAVQEILAEVFPDLLDILHVNRDGGQVFCVEVLPGTDHHQWFEYWRLSQRKIGTKGPKSNWLRWVWYHIRCRLIERFGGSCRDECDESVPENLDGSRYPSYRDYIAGIYSSYAEYRDDLTPEQKRKSEEGRQILIEHSVTFDRDRGLPVEASANI